MDAFVAAAVTTAAALRDDEVQVWLLPYRREEGRAPLRRLLAACLATDADALVFEHGAHGRPVLASPHAALDFSWSHSGDCALLALARGLPELGVDIERTRPRPRALELAARFFAAEESAQLQRLPDAARDVAFLALWTAKEAVLKGIGRGLAYGLERVAFDLGVDQTPRPTHFAGAAGPAADWRIQPLRPCPGFIGTLAWRGGGRQVHYFTRA
jgi:4'-phosphopantetheinyl transferase